MCSIMFLLFFLYKACPFSAYFLFYTVKSLFVIAYKLNVITKESFVNIFVLLTSESPFLCFQIFSVMNKTLILIILYLKHLDRECAVPYIYKKNNSCTNN